MRRVSCALSAGISRLKIPMSPANRRRYSDLHDAASATNSDNGSSSPKSPNPAAENEPPPPILPEYEIDLLKRSWRDDFNTLYELGGAIYEVIFEQEPDAKQLFPNLARHGDQWKESREFRSQALKFVQILSLAIRNIYRPELLNPILTDVGKAHVKYAGRGFRTAHWDVFQTAIQVAMKRQLMQETELSSEEKAEAVRAWKLFAAYIITQLKCGYVKEMQLLDATRNSCHK